MSRAENEAESFSPMTFVAASSSHSQKMEGVALLDKNAGDVSLHSSADTDQALSSTTAVAPLSQRRSISRPLDRIWKDISSPNSLPDANNTVDLGNLAQSLVSDERPEETEDGSSSRKEWLRQKRDEHQQNEFMDKIMSMVGHEEVKAHFLYVKDRPEVAKYLKEDLNQLRFDLVLLGNEGTGKKRIVEIYVGFLCSIGYIQERRTGVPVSANGSSTGEPALYYLSNLEQIAKPRRLASILNGAGSRSNKPTIILSSRLLNKSLINTLESQLGRGFRLPDPIQLSDFSEDELIQLLIRMIKKRSWDVQGGFGTGNTILRRIAKRAKRSTQGDGLKNVWALERELDAIHKQQEARYVREVMRGARNPGIFDKGGHIVDVQKHRDKIIIPSDIHRPKPTDMRASSKAWAQIQQMMGLENVKHEIDHLFSQATANYDREMQGKEPLQITLNRVFLGPPGVGKTTAARLYGEIVAELGLVSKGKVILKTPVDMLGQGSEKLTKNALDEAQGNVLIIDNAHMLCTSNDSGFSFWYLFRQAVTDTLAAHISGSPDEDRCVILVGNTDEMDTMLSEACPGLQHRFHWEDALRFEDYTEDELCDLLLVKLAREEIPVSKEGRRVAGEMLARFRDQEGFGNAWGVERFIARAKMRQWNRLKAKGVDPGTVGRPPLDPEDFDPDYDQAPLWNPFKRRRF